MSDRKNQIVKVALAIADESGLEAVTMRAVAGRLDVTPMALYRHVTDKETLLDEVLELAMAEIRPPDPSLRWDARVTALAGEVRDLAHRHPSVIGLAFSRPGDTPAVRGLVAAIHRAFEDAGVPARHHERLERMLSTFVVGYALSEVSGRFPSDHDADLAQEFAADLDDLMTIIERLAAADDPR